MADQLACTDAALTRTTQAAANFLVSHGPSFGPERWEEQSGYSPSTIAAEIAGLVAAADIAERTATRPRRRVWRGVADDTSARSRAGRSRPTARCRPPYFIRLSKTGDPNAAITYNVGNGGPTLDQRSVIDAGFLELVRLGELPANDPSPTVTEGRRRHDPLNRATGPGWHRYNGDGYGDRTSDGRPSAPSGNRHRAPLAGAVRPSAPNSRCRPATRRARRRSCDGMDRFAGGVSLIPEQDWEAHRPRPLAIRDAAGRPPRSVS